MDKKKRTELKYLFFHLSEKVQGRDVDVDQGHMNSI